MLNIGKIRGVLYSAVIVATYYKLILPAAHRRYFGFDPEYGFWTEVIFYGLITTQFVMMRSGEKVQLTFFGGPVKSFWGGFGVLPNILHFTVFLRGSALLWGLVRLKNDKYTYEEDRDVHLNVSDSNTKYIVNSTLPHWAAQLNRVIGIILEYLFVRWTRAPQEYKLSALGYSAYAVGVIMVSLNSASIVAKQKLNATAASISQSVGVPVQSPQRQATPVPQVQSAQQPVYAPQGQTVAPPPQAQDFVAFSSDAANRVPFSYNGTYYNLLEYRRPRIIPDPRWFSNKAMGGLGRTTDGIFYLSVGQYGQGDALRSINVVEQTSCIIVPKDSTAVIFALSPPKFVINMNDEVLVGSMPDGANRGVLGPNGSFWNQSMSWKMLHDYWGQRHNYMLGQNMSEMARARGAAFFVKGPSLDAELHPSLPTGLVCF